MLGYGMAVFMMKRISVGCNYYNEITTQPNKVTNYKYVAIKE